MVMTPTLLVEGAAACPQPYSPEHPSNDTICANDAFLAQMHHGIYSASTLMTCSYLKKEHLLQKLQIHSDFYSDCYA
jgi:hypothetical protein